MRKKMRGDKSFGRRIRRWTGEEESSRGPKGKDGISGSGKGNKGSGIITSKWTNNTFCTLADQWNVVGMIQSIGLPELNPHRFTHQSHTFPSEQPARTGSGPSLFLRVGPPHMSSNLSSH